MCRLTLVVTRVEPGQTKELIRARFLFCRLVVGGSCRVAAAVVVASLLAAELATDQSAGDSDTLAWQRWVVGWLST